MQIAQGLVFPRLTLNQGKITVTPQALSEQAGVVRDVNRELEEAFDRMRTLMNQTSNYWKGEAAEAHRESFNKNLPSIEEIIARYEEHVVDLEKMAGVYQEAEAQATNLADELPAMTL